MKIPEVSNSSILPVADSNPTPTPVPKGLQSVPDQLEKAPPQQGWMHYFAEKIGGFFAWTATGGGHVTYNDRIDIHPPKAQEIQLDIVAVKKRREEPSPSDEQIKQQVKQLSRNLARLLPMRIIDQMICGVDKPEDFYRVFATQAADDASLKEKYFKYLDRSDLFFLVHWVAKLSYIFLVPLCKRTIKDTTLSIFKNAEEFLDASNKTEFNESFNVILERSNLLLADWIIAMENITAGQEVQDVKVLLSKELSKPKYHHNMNANEFYNLVTKKLVKKYYVDFFLSTFLYNHLTSIYLTVAPSNWTFYKIPFGKIRSQLVRVLSRIIEVPLFCVALGCRILFIVPDYIFNWVLSMLIQRSMVRNRVIENIVERALQGISTNKGLSVPVLKSLNESLEEFLVEVLGKLPETKSEDGLSQKNQKALKRNVHLILRATDLYGNETVKDLKQMIASKEGMFKQMIGKMEIFKDAKADMEKAFEELFRSIYERLTDAKLLKHKGYYVIQALNESLTTASKTADVRNKEFMEQEKRLFSLIPQILVAAVKNKVKETGFSEEAMITNVIVNPVLKQTVYLVKNLLDMVTSRDFLNYQIRAGLAVTLLNDIK